MKKGVLSSILMFMCILALAQAPESFNYQVVVRDGSTNSPLTNQDVSFRMSILKGSSSGISQYSELHSANTGALGIVNLVIGNGTGKTGNITTIDWGADTYYLKVEIDKTGGSTYVEMGTTQLLSVPYALFAKSSATAIDAVKLIGDQTIAGNKIFTGTTTVLAPVNATDAATKAYVDILEHKISQLSWILEDQTNRGLVKDVEGNTYITIKIGTQVWMAENLKTINYNDGTAIPNITDYTEWAALTTSSYCWFYNDIYNKTTFGALYNWYTVDATSNGGKNVCPLGWHVPSDSEWTTLTEYLINNGYGYGGSGTQIAKAMAATSGWLTDPTAGNAGNDQASNNSSGFTALPSGYRYFNGTFWHIGYYAYWWSSTENSTTNAYCKYIYFNYGNVFSFSENKLLGLSVRCLKD